MQMQRLQMGLLQVVPEGVQERPILSNGPATLPIRRSQLQMLEMATIASQRQANPKKETSTEDDPCFDASTDEDANFNNNDQFDDDEDASGTDANGSAEDANMQVTEGEISAPPEASSNANGQINDEAQDDVPGEVSNSSRDSTGDESDAVGEQGGKNEEDSNTNRQNAGGGAKNQVLFSKAIGDDSDSLVQSEADSEEENAQNASLGNATSSQPAYKTTGEDRWQRWRQRW